MTQQLTEQIRQHFAHYPLKSYEKGQILVHAGEQPEHIFYIVSGRVRQYDISYQGTDIVVNIFKPGAFFPMSWAITRQPNRYFFSAETPLQVHVAPPDEVIALLRTSPDITYDLLARLYTGVDGLLGRMTHLMAGSAKSRLMHELLVCCHRFGTKQADSSCKIAVSETELATYSGLSRETVSRELSKMAKAGRIKMERRSILVTDLALLEKELAAEL